jgi:hypothetical protein
LKDSIEWVRNIGLTKGLDITLEEMLQKIGFTKERLLSYLRGEYHTMEDLGARLEGAYKELIEGIDRVVINEDLEQILAFEI